VGLRSLGREAARLDHAHQHAAGVDEADYVEHRIAEPPQREVQALVLEQRGVPQDVGPHEGERRTGRRIGMQADAQPAIRHHRVRMLPGLAYRCLRKTDPGVEIERLRDIRAVHREFQEAAEHQCLRVRFVS
jgi:hypothetical protein